MSIDTKKLRQAAASVRAFLKPAYGREIAAAADHIDAQAAEIAALQKRDVAADVALKEAASVITDRNAAIAALRQPWQPIETAPKDGTRVLLSTPTGKVADGAFYQRYGVWSWPYVMANPTHWMPMPAPPAALSGESNG